MVLNGVEIGGGSLRIYQSDVQEKVFKAIGLSEEEAKSKFGFMLDAFQHGTPSPHAGCAFGLDRLVNVDGKTSISSDVIHSPKNSICFLMVRAKLHSEVEPKQLKELILNQDIEEEEEHLLVKHRQELIKIQMSRLV